MRKCMNCDAEIAEGGRCFELPPAENKTIDIVLEGEERLFCAWCGGNIQYSLIRDDSVKTICDVSDGLEMAPII